MDITSYFYRGLVVQATLQCCGYHNSDRLIGKQGSCALAVAPKVNTTQGSSRKPASRFSCVKHYANVGFFDNNFLQIVKNGEQL